jgi:hypothetical protein
VKPTLDPGDARAMNNSYELADFIVSMIVFSPITLAIAMGLVMSPLKPYF